MVLAKNLNMDLLLNKCWLRGRRPKIYLADVEPVQVRLNTELKRVAFPLWLIGNFTIQLSTTGFNDHFFEFVLQNPREFVQSLAENLVKNSCKNKFRVLSAVGLLTGSQSNCSQT